jgi:hypothetical protein
LQHVQVPVLLFEQVAHAIDVEHVRVKRHD